MSQKIEENVIMGVSCYYCKKENICFIYKKAYSLLNPLTNFRSKEYLEEVFDTLAKYCVEFDKKDLI